jgi:hypothetical protein
MLFGGDALLIRWPWLWPVHLFLQPGTVHPLLYATNLAGLLLTGVGVRSRPASPAGGSTS